MTIFLLKYNNYYNRTIKRFSTINELLDRDDVVEIGTFQNVNFNPGDGVATQLTLNYTEGPAANYLIAEDSNKTFTSWFVLDAQYVRLGQYTLSLRRDLVQDLWDTLADSPLFVEKATLPYSSPLLFNNENMSYNQIKTQETTLKDKTGIPWIVGYCTKDFNATISLPKYEAVIESDYANIMDYPFYRYSNLALAAAPYKIEGDPQYRLNFYFGDGGLILAPSKQLCYAWGKDGLPADTGEVSTKAYLNTLGTGIDLKNGKGYYTGTDWLEAIYYKDASRYQQVLMDAILAYSWHNISLTDYFEDLHKESSLPVPGSTFTAGGRTYSIDYKVIGTDKTDLITVAPSSLIGSQMTGVADALIANKIFVNNGQKAPRFEMLATYTEYEFIITEILNQDDIMEVQISADRKHSKEIYDIFCIPYGPVFWGDGLQTSAEMGLLLANLISVAGSGGSIYDLQLLPYCPIPQDRFEFFSNPTATASCVYHPTEDDITITFPSDGTLAAHPTGLIWLDSGDFSLTVDAPAGLNLEVKDTTIEKKVEAETSFHRLTSPNYNGIFEFSAQKNDGVSAFDVDCSYKPYQPYIRISPRFGGLYGRDFNDARGLVLGGDFSLPQKTDEWIAYQTQNKNYQVMFDRQIDNMDVNNSVQRDMEGINILTGIAQGAVTAGMAGSMLPLGPAGWIGGAVAGGTLSAIGGAADRTYNEKLRQENRDYTKDQFGYQLGNIQARPDSLTKVSSFNPNNKLFPVLEYYTSTITEKQALRNKIKYNGMTVMTIGTIADYLQPDPSYIKGKLIRLNNDMEDYHIVNALADELDRGVYV